MAISPKQARNFRRRAKERKKSKLKLHHRRAR